MTCAVCGAPTPSPDHITCSIQCCLKASRAMTPDPPGFPPGSIQPTVEEIERVKRNMDERIRAFPEPVSGVVDALIRSVLQAVKRKEG